jgi:hypothetical protein
LAPAVLTGEWEGVMFVVCLCGREWNRKSKIQYFSCAPHERTEPGRCGNRQLCRAP